MSLELFATKNKTDFVEKCKIFFWLSFQIVAFILNTFFLKVSFYILF